MLRMRRFEPCCLCKRPELSPIYRHSVVIHRSSQPLWSDSWRRCSDWQPLYDCGIGRARVSSCPLVRHSCRGTPSVSASLLGPDAADAPLSPDQRDSPALWRLAIRLFGNIMSLEMAALLVLLVAELFWCPFPLLMLHIIEALIQAYIFGMLALIYIAGAIHSQHVATTSSDRSNHA